MGIFGIGTDIVKVSRINKLIINKKFLNRLFHKDEIKKCNKSKKVEQPIYNNNNLKRSGFTIVEWGGAEINSKKLK